jgi:hypothetical protein
MKTMKDNQLIAVFMGAQSVASSTDPSGELTNNTLVYEFEGRRHSCEFNSFGSEYGDKYQFQTSWDWLMPVVEKIEYIGFHVLIEQNYCRIGEDLDVRVWTVNNKIQCVYGAVVQFINWYNSQKQ